MTVKRGTILFCITPWAETCTSVNKRRVEFLFSTLASLLPFYPGQKKMCSKGEHGASGAVKNQKKKDYEIPDRLDWSQQLYQKEIGIEWSNGGSNVSKRSYCSG